MRAIIKKSAPTQPLDMRLRSLLAIISEDDAQTIDRIVAILNKSTLSPEDLEQLGYELLKIRPTLRRHRVWYKALDEIGVDLGRDRATLTRLVGPVRPKNDLRPHEDPNLDASMSAVNTGSITAQCQALAEEMHSRRVRHIIREESRAEFCQRSIREARAEFSSGGAGSDPEAIQFVANLMRALSIAPGDLLGARSAQ